MKRKSIIKFNFKGICLLITLTLFGASLVLSFYTRHIGNYLTTFVLLATSIAFLLEVLKEHKDSENQ